MERILETLKGHWQDGVNFLLGAWLIASPWILGFEGTQYASGNAYIPGVIIAVAAASALVTFHEWEEWVNTTLGLWLIAAPWLFEFGTFAIAVETQATFAATLNFTIAGILVTCLAMWSNHSMRKQGHLAT